MNIEVCCSTCGTAFMTCPQIGMPSMVKCPAGHANTVREANEVEAEALMRLASVEYHNMGSLKPSLGGISRRDYFAGLAMQALIPIMPNPSQSADMGKQESQLRLGISWAVIWADAMIQELDKK